MDTIQIKGSYKRVTKFLKKGEQLLENKINNKIIISYFHYLKSIDNKDSTINLKLMFICIWENFLIKNNKTFITFNKEDIYDYFNECSKLSWGLPYKDNNKQNIKQFPDFRR